MLYWTMSVSLLQIRNLTILDFLIVIIIINIAFTFAVSITVDTQFFIYLH